MHDTFLFKRIYDNVEKLCKEQEINHILKLEIDVYFDSHINAVNLRQFFNDFNNPLINNDSNIIVTRNALERLTAIIKNIEGHKKN